MNTARFEAGTQTKHPSPGTDRETSNRILDATDAPHRAASSRLRVRVCAIHWIHAGRTQSAPHEQCRQSFDFEDGQAVGLCGSNRTGRGKRVSDHPRISQTRGPVPTRTGPLCISAPVFRSTRSRTHNRIDRFTVCSVAAANTQPRHRPRPCSLKTHRDTLPALAGRANRNMQAYLSW